MPSYSHQQENAFGSYPPAPFGQISQPEPDNDRSNSSASARRDSLNPFAKPFVFGRPLDAKAEAWQPAKSTSVTITAPASTTSTSTPAEPSEPTATTTNSAPATIRPLGHSRLASVARLNVAAPEFKPRSAALPKDAEFTFSMPAASPAFPAPELPLAALAAVSAERSGTLFDEGSPIKKQGREKRPRLGSPKDEEDAEAEFVEQEDVEDADESLAHRREGSSAEKGSKSLTTFKFPLTLPPLGSPIILRESQSLQPEQQAEPAPAMGKSASMDEVAGRGDNVEGDSDLSDMDEVDSDEEDKENRRDTSAPASSFNISLPLLPNGLNVSKSQKDVSGEVANVTRDSAKAAPTQDTAADDDEEYVQELIIPPSLPGGSLSATFPTSPAMRSPDGHVSLSPISGNAAKRRAPIPLDFKHPNSTVPAGLFKALVQNVIKSNRERDNGKHLI